MNRRRSSRGLRGGAASVPSSGEGSASVASAPLLSSDVLSPLESVLSSCCAPRAKESLAARSAMARAAAEPRASVEEEIRALVDRAMRLEEELAAYKEEDECDEGGSTTSVFLLHEVVGDPLASRAPPAELSYDAYMDKGRLAFGQAKHKESLACFEAAYRLVDSSQDKDPLKLARAEANMANVFAASHLHRRALALVKSALNRLREAGASASVPKSVKDDMRRVHCFILSNAILFSAKLGKVDEALGFAMRKLACSDNPEDRAEAAHWIDSLNQGIEKHKDPANIKGEEVEGDEL